MEELQALQFSGHFLRRGFWLYAWEVTPPQGKAVFYVGRTGDSSSTKAQSPFNRMSQHLGFAKNSNMLRRHLKDNAIVPEECQFKLVALGPIEEEAPSCDDRAEHDRRRDLVAAMEKALSDEIREAGYSVLNVVKCRKELDHVRFAQVRRAFATAFPELAR